MTNPKNTPHHARRQAIRREVVPVEIKGLLDADGGIHVPFLIWDLSEIGLGIWIPDKIALGTRVRMNVAVPRRCHIEGLIQWCEESTNNLQGWRCGVAVDVGTDHVAALMEDVRKAKQTVSSGPISRA